LALVILFVKGTTKPNMGLKWYQSTAYDLPISRLAFLFYLNLNLNKRFSAASKTF
jgi:hypothetical protein